MDFCVLMFRMVFCGLKFESSSLLWYKGKTCCIRSLTSGCECYPCCLARGGISAGRRCLVFRPVVCALPRRRSDRSWVWGCRGRFAQWRWLVGAGTRRPVPYPRLQLAGGPPATIAPHQWAVMGD